VEVIFMSSFTKEELDEAHRAIASTLSKSEKVQSKLKSGTFQHTMIVQGIKSYNIAIELIKRESDTVIIDTSFESKYMKDDLEEVIQAITSANSRVEKILPKFETGTSQHTLAVRRIKAFSIATELIKRELERFT